jgi:hypothetical protein
VSDLVPELESLWRTLAITPDRNQFIESLRAFERLKQGLRATEIEGPVFEWVSRIDHAIFRRTRRGVHSFQVSGPTALLWLMALCSPWPLITGAVVALMMHSWMLGIQAASALYLARLGHELGHWLAGAPDFYLRGLYTSRDFIQLRLEIGVRAAWVRPVQLTKLYLGGCLANLALGLVGLVMFVGGIGSRTLAVALLGANLALGAGNLLPLRRPGTDGYNVYRVWRDSRPAKAT